jgi:hypothetical protein
VNDFQGFDYTAQSLQKAVAGEDTAILRLRLSNETILEIPSTTEGMHYLLRTLIDAYGTVALSHLRERKWIKD